jgi:hypothetical protein
MAVTRNYDRPLVEKGGEKKRGTNIVFLDMIQRY